MRGCGRETRGRVVINAVLGGCLYQEGKLRTVDFLGRAARPCEAPPEVERDLAGLHYAISAFAVAVFGAVCRRSV